LNREAAQIAKKIDKDLGGLRIFAVKIITASCINRRTFL